jgi:hypothetical protein
MDDRPGKEGLKSTSPESESWMESIRRLNGDWRRPFDCWGAARRICSGRGVHYFFKNCLIAQSLDFRQVCCTSRISAYGNHGLRCPRFVVIEDCGGRESGGKDSGSKFDWMRFRVEISRETWRDIRIGQHRDLHRRFSPHFTGVFIVDRR